MFKYWSRLLRVASTLAASVILLLLSGYTAATADGLHFKFVALSAASSADSVIFQGQGAFNQGEAEGSGGYTEFNPSIGSPPFPVISAGTWHLAQFQSFAFNGRYGDLVSGILVVRVILNQNFPTSAQIPAVLTVFCNIPPANLKVGHPEGIQLVEASKTFTQVAGFTGFNIPQEEEELLREWRTRSF